MTNRFFKRFFAISLVAALSTVALADAPRTSLRPTERPTERTAERFMGTAPRTPAAKPVPAPQVYGTNALIAEARLGGTVAFAVADAKSGLVLESNEARLGQPPASVTKAVTALYALNALGPGHRFHTRLMTRGTVSGGVVRGDLILMGGGDPTLSTDGLATMAKRLKAAGINKVTGDFLVSPGPIARIRQIDPAQPDHVSYNPALSGLNLNFNRVHFEWKRGNKGWVTAMDARSDKYRPPVTVARMSIAKRQVPVYSYAEKGGRDIWTVASGALGKGGSRWLPVRQPELYAGEVFRYFARAQGITLARAQLVNGYSGGTVLITHQSPELRVILRDMLKYSNNLTAEIVGLAATAKRKGRTRTLRSSGAEMSRWAQSALGMKGARLVDHSGLGEDSRLTAQDMAKALVRVEKAGVLKPILKKIPMRDSKGRVIKSHPIKVYAKTGTLNFVSALAGYMTAADGTEMAFAIFAADTGKRAAIKRADREQPQGARGWNKRAKRLQQRLIERWGALYGT
ncbi:MAG: D-alanyl-D-alanine carboxypeptidase/D-alanyl-D-alanine-endopeptidase [Rhodobacterales bacterium]|nr:MAG: D-alanyl-D-alanine carboxypeptidase/D-alanyl-D-alanine-endopeptidase [Rhodobacterales bacterium]